MRIDELDPDPIRQFETWLADARAAGLELPEAMTLATADTAGRPSARMVLLKGIDRRGFAFFTNRESRKAVELAANPRAALVFHWQPLHRQVRVEGTVEALDDDESYAYFRTRPLGSRLAAWASPQSRPLAGRAELEALYEEAEARFAGIEPPLPPFWGGYRVLAEAVELWQGRENRLHDRVRYELREGAWARRRLAP
ncbi:MAG TPA: pyridoxamine 5'-phosphate oxidase [Gaiellaceae bacterium]|nr:pyridoxamine 5'-phosphate oxidase [Gaiellaceae bacterium]